MFKSRTILLTALLLTALFLTQSGSAEAMSAKKIAQKSVAIQNQSYRLLLNKKIPQENKEALLGEYACAAEIINSAPENIDEGLLFTIAYLYLLDYYFTITRDARPLLNERIGIMKTAGRKFIKKARGKNGKRIARSLVDHASFAQFYLQKLDLNFCLIGERIEELGGYSEGNIEQAINEAIEKADTIKKIFSEEANERLDKMITRIDKAAGEMAALKIKARKVRTYRLPLIVAIAENPNLPNMEEKKRSLLGKKRFLSLPGIALP